MNIRVNNKNNLYVEFKESNVMKTILCKFIKCWSSSVALCCLLFTRCICMDTELPTTVLLNRIDKAHNSIQQICTQLNEAIPYMPRALSQQYKELICSLDSAVAKSRHLTEKLQRSTCSQPNIDYSNFINSYEKLTLKIAMQMDYIESAATSFKPFFDFQSALDADYALSLQLQESEKCAQHTSSKPVTDPRSRAKMACLQAISLHLGPTYTLGSTDHMPIIHCQGSIPRDGFGHVALPKSITNLRKAEILYYPSPRTHLSISGTCASRAIANALGIRDAIALASLEAPIVYKMADTHNDLHSHSSVTHKEAIELACALDFKNTYYINYVENFSNGSPKDNPFSITLSTEQHDPHLGNFFNLYTEERSQAEIINKIRAMPTITAFFLCSVDTHKKNDHCVLIAIVKQEGNIPKIIYMDCNNQQVPEHSKSAAFIHYLYLQCIAEN